MEHSEEPGGRGLEAQAPVSLALASSPQPWLLVATGLEQEAAGGAPSLSSLSWTPTQVVWTHCRGRGLTTLIRGQGDGKECPYMLHRHLGAQAT